MPHITVETRQMRRKAGSASQSASQSRTVNILRPSSRGRAKVNAAGRRARTLARNHRPHSPVISPSLASRNRGSRAMTETRMEATMVVSTNRATPSARRLTASVQPALSAGNAAPAPSATRLPTPRLCSR